MRRQRPITFGLLLSSLLAITSGKAINAAVRVSPDFVYKASPNSAAIISESSCEWSSDILEDASSGFILSCPNDKVLVGLRCHGADCAQFDARCCHGKGTFHGGDGSPLAPGRDLKAKCGKQVLSYHREQPTDPPNETKSTRYLAVPAQLSDIPKTAMLNQVATGLICKDESCTSLSLQGRPLMCGSSEYLIPISEENCGWTEVLDRTQSGSITCSPNQVLTGLRCLSAQCLELAIRCCPFGDVCPSGHFGDNMICQRCPPGQYGDSAGLTSERCSNPCPRGTYSEKYGLRSASQCEKCPLGSYNDVLGASNVLACKPCPPGRFGSRRGLTSRECSGACPLGTFSNKAGISSKEGCKLCPPGTYNDRTGSTECKLCPKGTYNSDFGAASRTACEACPRNYYQFGCISNLASMS